MDSPVATMFVLTIVSIADVQFVTILLCTEVLTNTHGIPAMPLDQGVPRLALLLFLAAQIN